MPLYLGLPPSKNQTVSADLEARDIKLLRCTPSQLRYIGGPELYQPGFREYEQYLPAFMSSCQKQATVDLRQFAHPVSIPLSDCMPFRYPNVSVAPLKASAEVDQALLELGGSVEIIRDRKVFQFLNPTGELLGKINKLGVNKGAMSSNNFVNFQGIDAFRLTVKVASEFAQVHRYPAYVDDKHTSDHYKERTEWSYNKEAAAGDKRGRADDDEGEDEAGPSKQQKGDQGQAENVSPHKDSLDTSKHEVARHWKVMLNKPPSKAVVPWATSTDDLPPTNGIWAPFVPQLQFYDGDLVCSVIRRRFLGSLSLSLKGCLEAWDQLKRNWGILSQTEVGRELTHYFFCIDVALMCQARPVALFIGGRYTGTFISGAGYRIQLTGQMFKPIPFKDARAEIEESSTHRKILEKILKEAGFSCDPEELADEGTKALSNPNLTMMSLRKILLTAKMSMAQKKAVEELLPGLDFRHVHLGINGPAIARCLLLISDMGIELPDDLPIHHSVIFSTSRLELVWSCFGYAAPTLRPVNSKMVSVGAKTHSYEVRKKDSKDLETVTLKFDHMFVRNVSLKQAIADLKEVQSSKEVGLLWGKHIRRESFNADRKIDGEAFVTMKGALMRFCAFEDKSGGKDKPVTEEKEDDVLGDDDF